MPYAPDPGAERFALDPFAAPEPAGGGGDADVLRPLLVCECAAPWFSVFKRCRMDRFADEEEADAALDAAPLADESCVGDAEGVECKLECGPPLPAAAPFFIDMIISRSLALVCGPPAVPWLPASDAGAGSSFSVLLDPIMGDLRNCEKISEEGLEGDGRT